MFTISALALTVQKLWAATLPPNYGLDDTAAKLNYTVQGSHATIPGLIATIISLGLSLLVIAFFGLTLYSGVRWMTARGNEEFVEKAKNNLQTSIIGLAVVVAAYGIARFVLKLLGA